MPKSQTNNSYKKETLNEDPLRFAGFGFGNTGLSGED